MAESSPAHENVAVELSTLVDYLCLCYHEARNVRHLIREGHVPAVRFERLRALPVNKFDAWNAMAPVRAKGKTMATARAVSDLFSDRFGCSIDGLIELYLDSHWRSSAYGGNPWAKVATAVRDLQRALDAGRATQAAQLVRLLPEMSHNNGLVGEKLALLERATDAAS